MSIMMGESDESHVDHEAGATKAMSIMMGESDETNPDHGDLIAAVAAST